MRKVQLEVDEPLALAKRYSSQEFNELKESCGIPTSSYPVKGPEPTKEPFPDPVYVAFPEQALGDSLTLYSPTCLSKLIGKKDDTINIVAKSNSVSTDWLLMYNSHLPPSINDTLAGGELICMDDVPKCILHQVKTTDSCSSLMKVSGKKVNSVMLASWNPTVGNKCRNLHAMVDKYICVSPPGDTNPFDPVEVTPSPITTSESTYSWTDAPNSATSPVKFTTIWDFPTEAVPIATVTITPPSNDHASAIRARKSHCPFLGEDTEEWDKGLADDEYRQHSDDLSPECIDEWDPYCYPVTTGPILPSPTDIASSCYPTISTIIPEGFVKPPAATNLGSSEDCNKWHVVGTGDNCVGLENRYKISHASFMKWNPSLDNSCRNLRTAMAYCVRVWEEPVETAGPTTTASKTSSVRPTSTSAGPPGPTQSGTSPTCKKWHLQKQGDTCASIATTYGIIVSRFRQLNRGVDASCTNLVNGNAYCVG